MATQAEIDRALAAGVTARAQSEAILAAARARAILDAVQPPSLWDYLTGGGAFRDATAELARLNPANAIVQAAASAAQTASTVLDVLKWIGIVVAIIVGLLIALWMIVLLTGAKWALATLTAIAPHLATGAAAYAKVAG